MVSRKLRTPVDTNVFVRGLKSRSNHNSNRRVLRLWLVEKRLQLMASRRLIEEYLGIFADVLGMDEEIVREWRDRFEHDDRATLVNLGKHPILSRDPDDDLLLATALAGRAEYLISNDRDLLELPISARRELRYEIVTPRRFLELTDF